MFFVSSSCHATIYTDPIYTDFPIFFFFAYSIMVYCSIQFEIISLLRTVLVLSSWSTSSSSRRICFCLLFYNVLLPIIGRRHLTTCLDATLEAEMPSTYNARILPYIRPGPEKLRYVRGEALMFDDPTNVRSVRPCSFRISFDFVLSC